MDHKLYVFIEINGQQRFVGTIAKVSSGEGEFAYAPEYLSQPDAAAISCRLPLREEPFDTGVTRNFFEGLLPEGFTRRSVAGWIHADSNDYLTILAGLGKECLGAIRILESQDESMETGYELLSIDQVKELAREGASKSAELVTKSHLSLAGASGKVGLYYHPLEKRWYQPVGDAPSTHIVKQSHVRLEGIVANEQLALMTARNCGLLVPDSFIIDLDQARDEDVLFATERFDRAFPVQGENGFPVQGDRTFSAQEGNGFSAQGGGKFPSQEERGSSAWEESGANASRGAQNTNNPPGVTGGASDFPVPYRLHQEDFSQALGIGSLDKYENQKSGYMKKCFDLLRKYSANPIEDQMRLWEILLFDFLVGNTDNHIKNVSLLYSKSLQSVRLAPAYDIVSTCIYDASTRDMAIYFGDVCSLDDIDRKAIEQAAAEAAIGKKMAMSALDRLAGGFESGLSEAARVLKESGFVQADQMKEQILARSGYRNIL